jgi:flagellar motor component MotA
MAMGGKLNPLWPPFELVIIAGGGGAYIVANPKFVLAQ